MFVVPKKSAPVHIATLDGRAWHVPIEGRELPDEVASLNAVGLDSCIVKKPMVGGNTSTAGAEVNRKKGE